MRRPIAPPPTLFLALAASGCALVLDPSFPDTRRPDASAPQDDRAGFDASAGDTRDAPADDAPADDAPADDVPLDRVADTTDAGLDASPDADAATDAGFDVARDLGFDAGVDSGADAGVDVRADTGVDAGVDAGFDARADAGADAPDAACPDDAELAPPRPVAPLSGSVVAGNPALRWELAGTSGARLEVCADRACTRIVASTSAGDTTVTVLGLPVAPRYFWRLAGRRGACVGRARSPTWSFWPRAPSGRITLDGAWGAVPDFDGDGVADLLVGAPGTGVWAGTATVFPGGAGFGTASTPTRTLAPPDALAVGFGQAAASAGDVDGDGFVDAAVGARSELVAVFHGSPAGLAATPAVTLRGAPALGFGRSIAGLGDFDGDGFGDVAASDEAADRVLVFWGARTGLDASRVMVVGSRVTPVERVRAFGRAIAAAGDVDGDGRADLLVGAPGLLGATPGRAFVVFGAPRGTTPRQEALTLPPEGASASHGAVVAGAGDINADGLADVAVSDTGTLHVNYYLGTRGMPLRLFIAAQLAAIRRPVTALANAGDTDGDGFDDLALGVAGDRNAYVVRTQTGDRADNVFESSPGYGAAVAGVGDLNGDGRDDVAVGVPDTGVVRVYFGRAGRPPPNLFTSGLTLGLGGAGGPSFGASLASGR